MSSDYPEVRDILSALSVKVSSCSESLSARQVDKALYGLRRMGKEYDEVGEMIFSLNTVLFKSNNDQNEVNITKNPDIHMNINGNIHIGDIAALNDNTPVDLSNSIYGLQGTRGDFVDVRDVVSILSANIRGYKEEFSTQDQLNLLYAYIYNEESRQMLSGCRC
jgi:hypothetical protein